MAPKQHGRTVEGDAPGMTAGRCRHRGPGFGWRRWLTGVLLMLCLTGGDRQQIPAWVFGRDPPTGLVPRSDAGRTNIATTREAGPRTAGTRSRRRQVGRVESPVSAPTGELPYSVQAEPYGVDAWRVTLMVDQPRFVPATEPGQWRVVLGDASGLAVKGEPALPFVRHEVLLGAAAEPALEIGVVEWEEAPCPPLALSPGFVSRSPDAGSAGSPVAKPVPVQTASLFPTAPAWLSPEYRWRGLRGVGVVFCPWRYDAARGVLARCCRLEVTVRGAAPADEITALSAEVAKAAARRWPEHVLSTGKSFVETATPEALLVLLPQAWSASADVAAFVQWKRQRGVRVSVEGLAAPVTASTVRSRVASFAAAQEAANVLLLGNENAIPLGQASPPSDTVYALLDGSGDRYHDLYVSRLPAATVADLAGQLGRVVMYERWQWPGAADGAWCGSAVGIASDANQGNLGLRDREAMELVRADLMQYGYSPCDAIYDTTGQPAPGSAPVVAAWNAGRGLVLYLGHGLPQSWRTTGFSVNTVTQSLFYRPSLPIVVSAACYTGNFSLSTDCLCESLVKAGTPAAPTGAIAAIGATSSMDWDPPVVMLQSFAAYLTERASFSSGGMTFDGTPPRTTAGEMAFDAVQRAVDFCLATPVQGDAAARKIVEQTHLFGDPTLGVRTRPPSGLNVQHDGVALRGAGLSVSVCAAADGRPMSNLTVCLCTPAGSQWLEATGESGEATIAVPAGVSESTATLTVYGPDVIPYQATVPVCSQAAPVVIETASLPTGMRGETYTATLLASGGTGQGLAWSALSVLPEWLTLSVDGALAGTPAEPGCWQLTLRAEDRGMPTLHAETTLPLTVVAGPADLDGDSQVDTGELLAFASRVAAGGVAAEEWPVALRQWIDGGEGAPVLLPGQALRASPEQRFGAVRYLPGGQDWITVDLGLIEPVQPGSAAVLTEVLPEGWEVSPNGARDATGRRLPGPRRDGDAWSWFVSDDTLSGGRVSIPVRPQTPASGVVAIAGWVTWLDGTAEASGDSRWWPRSEQTMTLALERGWNLCALPLAVPPASLPPSFVPATFRQCGPGGRLGGPAAEITPLAAYWVFATAPAELQIGGYEPLVDSPVLGRGWAAGGVGAQTPPAALPGSPRAAWCWTARGWVQASELVPGRGYVFFTP